MTTRQISRICCLLALFAALVGAGAAYAEEKAVPLEAAKELNEMPVMTGEQWQALTPDSKIAFLWGIGHVVTVEECVLQRHPELKRNDFVAKLGEGLRGIPMKTIAQQVDGFYQAHPEDVNLPVMRVIWRQIVKPKLTSGIADRPLTDND